MEIERVFEIKDGVSQALYTRQKLPEGVHRLSQESIDILARAHQRGVEVAARHIKRGS